MEREEFSRFREEFERLYQQPDLPNLPERVTKAASDRPSGFMQKLQTLWQHVSMFWVESAVDASPGSLTWWQMHHLRLGTCTPSFSDSDASKARDWLERVYRQ